MPVNCSSPAHRGRTGGFSLVELVAVTLLLGILAVVLTPRLSGTLSLRDAAWRDQVLAALQQARALAASHRRLVCATLATNEVRLAIADINPATVCSSTLAGPDADARWAHDDGSLTLTVSPAGTLYFQPDGRITSDGAGRSTVTATVTVGSQSAITLRGETGHVQ